MLPRDKFQVCLEKNLLVIFAGWLGYWLKKPGRVNMIWIYSSQSIHIYLSVNTILFILLYILIYSILYISYRNLFISIYPFLFISIFLLINVIFSYLSSDVIFSYLPYHFPANLSISICSYWSIYLSKSVHTNLFIYPSLFIPF